MNRTFHSRRASAWALLTLFLCASLALRAGEGDAPPAPAKLKVENLLPADAVFHLVASDLSALAKACEASAFGQLYLEPDMQLFLKPGIDAALKAYVDYRTTQNPLAPNLDDLCKVFTGQVGLSVAAPAGDGPPIPGVCVIIEIGDKAAAERLLAPLLQGKPIPEGTVFPEGGTPGVPKMYYEKGLLHFSTMPELTEAIRARIAKGAAEAEVGTLAAAPAWQDASKLLGGHGHILMVGNTAKLLKLAEDEAPAADAAKLKEFLDKSGLRETKAVALKLGSRGDFISLDLGIPLTDEPKGLVKAVLAPEPLPATVLQGVPAGATFVSAGRTNLAAGLDLLTEILDERGTRELDKLIAEGKTYLGIDVRAELIPALGDVIVTYDVGGTEYLGFFPSAAARLTLKDPATVSKAIDTLIGTFEKEMAGAENNPNAGMGFGPEVKFHEIKIGETRVRYMTVAFMPLSPAVAIVKDRLLVTMSVNGMRRALRALDSTENIAESTGFQKALARITGKPVDLKALPGQFSYCAPGGEQPVLNAFAGLMQMVVGLMEQQAKMQRAWGGQPDPETEMALNVLRNFRFELFPSSEVISKHLHPTASVLDVVEGGAVLRQDLAIPTMGMLNSGQGSMYTLPILAGIAVPNLLRSRLAANESAAIAACKTFAGAQDIYRRTDYDQDGILEYAQCIHGNRAPAALDPKDLPAPRDGDEKLVTDLIGQLNSEDFNAREKATADLAGLGPRVLSIVEAQAKAAKDAEVRARLNKVAQDLRAKAVKTGGFDTRYGLYSMGREGGEDGDLSLVDPMFAAAEGNPSDEPTPKAGYCFKVLHGQGPEGPGGKKSYLVKGNMTIGYAIVAYPAEYNQTGRNTFILNNTGTVYQNDLGEDTAKIVEEMTEYNPGDGWVVAE